ncbi:DAD1-like seeding establishment-related lipase [Hibiscus trionum]|uniref:Phospholipase A1 n=1 Tax=Hibiscus trionum TaxID=183268 RepID=A0A9W7MIA8_HIBTR|nr:DAD1-like seeding establishment-related lipase [Hibiscus trionum]
MSNSIATRWRKLSGEKNWEGLLQPLDSDLRKYLIHYAQMTGAVGDIFNSNTDEPDASKEDFFSKACLVKGNPYKYDVTRFIYAGSDDVGSSWFGYVAVATGEGKRALGRRDVLVAWRGTSSTSEWLNDFNFIIQRSASDIFPTAKQHGATVHRGFHNLYTGTRPDSTHSKTSAREQVLEAVKELVNKYKDEEISITVTGFSLGAALATLTAMDIVANGYNKPTKGNPDKLFMVTAITFGGPRVGNTGLACLFDSLGDHLHLLRIKNNRDFVPTLPPGIFLYTEFGIKLIVDTYNSKFLKWRLFFGRSAALPDEHEHEDEPNRIDCLDENGPKRKRVRRDMSSLNEDDDEDEYGPQYKIVRGGMSEYYSCHNMEVYAHEVAIKDIGKNTPADKLDYSIILVNKHLDRVKNEYEIPPNWWTGENRKKMVQSENGRWVVV